MPATLWSTLDRWMRKLHLWTGLFLVPWMAIYATSALLLNHRGLAEWFGGGRPQWQTIQTVRFTPPAHFPAAREQQAREILKAVGLSGAHRIQGPQRGDRLVIVRIHGAGPYRVTWQRAAQRIRVERQQPFSAVRLIHFLHFRAGFQQRWPAFITWAVVVDLVVLSIVLWIVSGIYLWSRMRRVRLSGGLCLAAGCGLFLLLVMGLCR